MKLRISTLKSFTQLKQITSLFSWNNLYEVLGTKYCISTRLSMGPLQLSLPPWLEPLVTPLLEMEMMGVGVSQILARLDGLCKHKQPTLHFQWLTKTFIICSFKFLLLVRDKSNKLFQRRPNGKCLRTTVLTDPVLISVEQIEDFCHPNAVQDFRWEIQSDPNPVDLSKYLIQSDLYPKKTLIKHFFCSVQLTLDIHIISGGVFSKSSSIRVPVLNCRIRLDLDPETGSCSTLVLIHALQRCTGAGVSE